MIGNQFDEILNQTLAFSFTQRRGLSPLTPLYSRERWHLKIVVHTRNKSRAIAFHVEKLSRRLGVAHLSSIRKVMSSGGSDRVASVPSSLAIAATSDKIITCRTVERNAEALHFGRKTNAWISRRTREIGPAVYVTIKVLPPGYLRYRNGF